MSYCVHCYVNSSKTLLINKLIAELVVTEVIVLDSILDVQFKLVLDYIGYILTSLFGLDNLTLKFCMMTAKQPPG